ncbi:hypothetical protein FZ041_12575 [Selenomonas caprae]|uniref:Type I restriction modification DNA specificity domain-containing protein n=1 Tax=Selenomonas caprae TaxID=2606905 RepID=A0A5D6WKV3_9FIRM|nr:restriction endonuclease subunit S [Selenomonas caprae]TYZ27054.1 hypothetical protein FZ041_12575 [Selenomonas caprae]
MKHVLLGDICDIQSGGTPSRSCQDYWKDGDIPWVKISDISGKYIKATEEKISQHGLDNSSAKLFPAGTILYTIFATLGTVGILDVDAATNQAIAGLQLKDKRVVRDFLYYYLESCKSKVNAIGRGVAQNNINMKILRAFEVPLYNVDKQKEIVKKFNVIENLLCQYEHKYNILEQLVKSRFVEMFGGNKYPIQKIGTVAKLQGGYAFKSKDYIDGGIPLVQITNVSKSTLIWEEKNCVPTEYLEKYDDFCLNVGDIVMAMTRPVIKSLDAVKVAILNANDTPCLLNQRVGRFIIDADQLNPIYLMTICQMDEFKQYVELMSGNSLQPNISSKQVEDYEIILPPLNIQKQFADFVALTDKSKLSIQQSIETLQTLKAKLMQDYFG